jgi:hypothetical protein
VQRLEVVQLRVPRDLLAEQDALFVGRTEVDSGPDAGLLHLVGHV